MAMGHRRLLEPWEIPDDDLEGGSDDQKSVSNATTGYETGTDNWNTTEDPPWLKRDKKKIWIMRVFGQVGLSLLIYILRY